MINNLEALNKEELREKIHASLKLFLNWYCHADGVNSLYIYYRDMIVGDDQAALARYNRLIDRVGGKYLKLLNIYYQKIGNHTTSPEFILLTCIVPLSTTKVQVWQLNNFLMHKNRGIFA